MSPSSLPKTMRAVAIKDGAGPSSSLYINDSEPLPTPTPTQALVKIVAFGLNRMDTMQREGQYPVPAGAPSIMGVEFSGTIVTLPSDPSDPDHDWKVGDEVFGLAYGGAYAQYIAVSPRMLIPKPSELSFEVCAGIPETWITATQALFLVGEFKKGQSVLWHAGASSVSIAGIQLSKHEGASAIYVTASSKEKIDFCKELGATEGFNYREGDWSQELLKATDGKGVDLIIDFIGGSYFNQNLDAVARDGKIVNLGFLGGTKVQVEGGLDIARFLRKRCRFEGSSLRSRDELYQGRLRDQLVEHALPKLRDGSFQVPIEKIFKMEEIKNAHDLMESNRTKGKLICTID